MTPSVKTPLLGWWIVSAAACSGAQSTLNPAGADAEDVATLFWWMAGGAALLWLFLLGLGYYCVTPRRKPYRPNTGLALIAGGGVALPVVVLVPLMAFSLPPLPRLVDSSATSPIRIEVSGEQWFWRVRYVTPSHAAIDLANEIRLPVGERIDLTLSSDNVIHSFWIPSLSGKVDMIPGRTTFLSLEPLRTGEFRGVCAEYCGTSHALMAFAVEVVERDEFLAWLDRQAAGARDPASAVETRGQNLFAANGCGACHAIRGTPARGAIGPDLTHVSGRVSLAGELTRWIAHADRMKPGAKMPSFAMLPSGDIADIAAYLSSLQ